MDFLYSFSLLTSLVAGCAGVLLGVLALLMRAPGRPLVRAGLSAVVLAALGLLTSVTVHWHWGHGPASAEPMGVARFMASHTAFLVTGTIITVGLVLVLYARRRGVAA